jgi:hypothetical protein
MNMMLRMRSRQHHLRILFIRGDSCPGDTTTASTAKNAKDAKQGKGS